MPEGWLRDYAQKATCDNPYHQKVTTRYLGSYDIFELKTNPQDKQEIFTFSRIISRRIGDHKIKHDYLGKRQIHYGKGKWKKFINRAYNP